MFKIQTLNTLSPLGLVHFEREYYEISSEISFPDAILVRSASLHQYLIPESVKAIGRAGAGLNNIPVHEFTKMGIPVFNTPGANANAVRELVIGGMLIASRHMYDAIKYVKELSSTDNELIEKIKKQFVGTELLGKTLGVIGLGSIGVKVANALIQLGMDVIGYDPTISVSRAWELSSAVKAAKSIDEVLITADFLSLHVPLTPETKHFLNSSRLSLMKKNAVLLNFARHEIIDTDSLLSFLNNDHLQNYVCDFPCQLLKDHPKVISLPHLGASTKEAEANCAVMLVKQIRDYLEHGAITHSANFPTVVATPLLANSRLAIVNANIPNMVAQISTCLAKEELNITSLVNQSRDDIAYTLIDVDHQISDKILREIKNIDGVLKVRQLLPKAPLTIVSKAPLISCMNVN